MDRTQLEYSEQRTSLSSEGNGVRLGWDQTLRFRRQRKCRSRPMVRDLGLSRTDSYHRVLVVFTGVLNDLYEFDVSIKSWSSAISPNRFDSCLLHRAHKTSNIRSWWQGLCSIQESEFRLRGHQWKAIRFWRINQYVRYDKYSCTLLGMIWFGHAGIIAWSRERHGLKRAQRLSTYPL